MSSRVPDLSKLRTWPQMAPQVTIHQLAGRKTLAEIVELSLLVLTKTSWCRNKRWCMLTFIARPDRPSCNIRFFYSEQKLPPKERRACSFFRCIGKSAISSDISANLHIGQKELRSFSVTAACGNRRDRPEERRRRDQPQHLLVESLWFLFRTTPACVQR